MNMEKVVISEIEKNKWILQIGAILLRFLTDSLGKVSN